MNDDNNNEELNEIEDKKREIEEREISRGNKITNFIKNPFGGFGRLLENGLTKKREKSGIKEFFKRLPLKFKLILIGCMTFIVLVLVVIIAVGDNSMKKVIKNRANTVNNFKITESSTEMEKLAIELFNNYDSMLAFTSDQLNKMYEDFKAMNNTELEYLVTSGKKDFGSIIGSEVNKSRPLYEHIIRTEKYNFNAINWRKYTHKDDDIKMDTCRIDELELDVPVKETEKGEKEKEVMPEEDETIATLMKTTSPYILTNDIPLGLLTGLVSSGNSRSSADQSRAQKFVYQSIKECLAKITVNKYILESIKFNTVREEFDIVKYRRTDSYIGVPVYNEKGEMTGTTVAFMGTVSKDILDTKPGPEKEEKKESDDRYSYDTYWYVAKAKVYDADIVNNFDYQKYIDDDVKKIVNPDVTTFLYADPFERVIEGAEPAAPGSLALGQVYEATSEYTAEVGAFNHYEKEWKDKLSPTSTDYNKYDFDDFKEYNTTQDDNFEKIVSYSDKKVMSEKEFDSDTSVTKKDIKRYEKEDKANNLYGLSLVDFMESNSNIYKKYLTKNSEFGTFIGLGRNKLKEGYKQTKNILNSLLNKEISIEGNTSVSVDFNSSSSGVASNKTLPFVYGSSLGYQVTMLYPSTSLVPAVSGLNLLKEYIRSWEGVGKTPITQNSEGVDCYTAYIDAVGKLTVGYGINLDAHPDYKSRLESALGITITDGTKVPVEDVDAIEDELIQSFYDNAKNAANGLDLKEYQLHALASMNYNGINISKIANYYNDPSYWNEETDDKFEEVSEKYKGNESAVSQIQAEADYSRGLYSNWIGLNTHADGKELPGLVRRRKSEYVLFSLGYYDQLQKFYYAGGGIAPNGAILVPNGQVDEAACVELQHWFEGNILPGASAASNMHSWKTANKGGFNGAYSKYATGSSEYQCPWWSRLRANMFLEANGHAFLTGSTGHGASAASSAATQLHINYYTGDQMDQLKPNSIISYSGGEYGHVAYVEAVSQDFYVISHCGSGTSWHGVQIVPKNKNGLSKPVAGFCCLEEAL